MRDRGEQILRLVCLVLAAVVVYEIATAALRINPLRGVAIPALPALVSETNAVTTATGTNIASTNALTAKGTNMVVSGSNALTGKILTAAKTNSESQVATRTGTNFVEAARLPGTNVSVALVTNEPASTNAQSSEVTSLATNLPPKITLQATNELPATNPLVISESATGMLKLVSPTNLVSENLGNLTNDAHWSASIRTNALHIAGTNLQALASVSNLSLSSTNRGTNRPAARAGASNAPMMQGMAGMPGGARAKELPPEIKARVSRIYESEIFGQIMRPLPMALLGIAGNTAIVRSPSGQTGLVKEGDSLGEIKLLRIGVNRVLVEQDGQKKELTIFEGYGGESLMPKESETSK